MKVYDIDFEVNDYQSLYFSDRTLLNGLVTNPMLNFHGKPLSAIWKPIDVFVYRPKLKVPHLYAFEQVGTMIADEQASEELCTFFEMAGEILPVKCGNRELGLINITECINCLDHERTEWFKLPDGTPVNVERFVFHKNLFSASSLFKIPESIGMLTVEDTGDPECEFKAACEALGYEGLWFRLLWDSEA